MTQDVKWKEVDGELRPHVQHKHREVVATWAPQPGSQSAFLSCPVFECLYEGPRGPGKTDALLMDFAQHVGKGYGADWRGILFRQTFPQLADVIAKSKKWFPRIFPQANFNEAKTTWNWPSGEVLRFAALPRSEDYWNFHGHAYPWIGFEELTTWPDDSCYRVMMSCSRSTRKDMPRRYRATTNPYGVGHNWVKARFRLPIAHGKTIGPLVEIPQEPDRCVVHGNLQENKILLTAEPDYVEKVRGAARNANELAAWLEGSWDITAGGMFDDIWDPRVHMVPDIPPEMIPKRWKMDRAYDHGQSKPFSVGWWAVSNGEPIVVRGTTIGAVPGDLIRVFEWYGWSGVPNEGLRLLASEIAQGIKDREADWGLSGRVRQGIADASIFDPYERSKSVAGDMAKLGIRWNPSDKSAGSRKQGWEQIRKWLKAALEPHREHPALYACERCDQYRRTLPVLPRSDKDLDDVNTEAEDHIGDEVRYRVRQKLRKAKQGRF